MDDGALARHRRRLVDGLLNPSSICARRYLEHRSAHVEGRGGKRRNGAIDVRVGNDLIVLRPRARLRPVDGYWCGHRGRVSDRTKIRAGGPGGVHGDGRTRDSRFAADDIVDEEKRPGVVVGDCIRLDGVEDLVVLQGNGRGVLADVLRHQETVGADGYVSA